MWSHKETLTTFNVSEIYEMFNWLRNYQLSNSGNTSWTTAPTHQHPPHLQPTQSHTENQNINTVYYLV